MLERRWICLGLLLCAACVSLPVSGDAPFALGPYVKFLTPHSAAIAWQTEKPATAAIEIRQNGSVFAVERIESASDSPQAILGNLQPKGKYVYQIALHGGGVSVQSPTYEIDNSLNFTKYPLADFASPFKDAEEDERCERLARTILSQTGITQGYCLVFGCIDGRLAYELAKQSELTVIGFDSDSTRIQAIRQRFLDANLYGIRFTFYPVASLDELPVPDCFANLVVSERMLEETKSKSRPICRGEEIARVLRPGGEPPVSPFHPTPIQPIHESSRRLFPGKQ